MCRIISAFTFHRETNPQKIPRQKIAYIVMVDQSVWGRSPRLDGRKNSILYYSPRRVVATVNRRHTINVAIVPDTWEKTYQLVSVNPY